MGVAEGIVWLAERATHELVLFAAVGLALGSLDDLVVDLIWLGRTIWRRLFVYSRHKRASAATLTSDSAGRVAVFVPAWREAGVIAPMLTTALARWAQADLSLYVGCYPNDPETWNEVERVAREDPRIRPVLNPRGIM